MQTIVVPTLAHFMPSQRISIQNLESFKDLELADPYFYKPAAIEMIIGSDYLPFINLSGVRMNIDNNFEARESHFGWYLMGPEPTTNIQSFHTVIHPSDDLTLHEQLKQFWEIEEAERGKLMSDSDLFCEDFFKHTTVRRSDGRYVVRLPFKEQYPHEIFLGPSRAMALAQYHQMEKKLCKTPELKVKYDEVLKEYLDLDHMEPTSYYEAKTEKVAAFFLPHHAVIKPESKSTKVRVVFNASKKTASGFSLNDVLHQGPALQADLMQLVLRWRYYRYVFTGDVQKMYRQILVDKLDRPYQQILFRNNVEGPVNTFQLKTVTFGVNCAPYLAIRTLLALGEDCQNLFPKASTILRNEVYVDDILSGGHSIEEARLKQDELIKALRSAGFPLKKMTANNHTLLQHLPREDLLDEDFMKFSDSSMVKTLGIRWNALTDKFYYAIEPIETTPSFTKRKILSVIARLFDPLGWLGPIIIVSKTLMQELWKEKSDWDEGISPHLLVKWNSFLKNLPFVSQIQIPRWIDFSPQCSIQIHGFCDASEQGYCAAVYIRSENPETEFKTHLLAAKTRVAPIKKTTIPKLELCGALLLSKLIRGMVTNLHLPYELFLWTDSSIVLGWLQKPPHTLKTFVANRVTQIINIANAKHWKHIKTEENPADIGTRGCTPQELASNHLWWHGPTWLQLPMSAWPSPRSFDPTDLESKTSISLHLDMSCIDVLEEFSSYPRALRVLCYRMRFINRLLKRPFSTEKFITTQEISAMKTRLLSLTQKAYFYREYECLKKMRPVSHKSRLLNLNPFIDKDDLLRVGGRLVNSGLSYNERHPVIIPEGSHLAKLLVNFTHLILLHSEHHIMLRAIRQAFYIPRLKNLVRKCIRNCKTCTIYKHQFQHQIMAALPPERVNFSLPFTYTGVDFAGPFNIKSSSLRNAKILKGYAAVFVCFSTRAVHLEICSDLSTDAFLACFDRFTGRRGLPKTMYSDNGRNFLGASYRLLKGHNEFLKSTEKSLIDKYGTLGFTWSFIPPYAPHMGGLWEAAVRSMKSHLKRITSHLSFTFEEFTTLLVRIEAVLNSRPLSSITENPNELLPLTPGHLLRGAPITALPEAPIEPPPEEIQFLKRWQRLKALQHIFARCWKSEYITELQRRFKWKTERENIKINDIVVIKDDTLPPTEWLLGRVTNVIFGSDGKVRVVTLQTKTGTIIRPVVKLCILPTGNSTETTGKLKCHFCNKNHPLKYCKVFRSAGINTKRTSIINKGWCLNCLSNEHTRHWCSSRNRCEVEVAPNKLCNARHHSMLHRDTRDPYSSSFEEEYEPWDDTENLESNAEAPESTELANATFTVASPTANRPLHTAFTALNLTADHSPPEKKSSHLTRTRTKWPSQPPLVRINLNYKGQKMFTNFYVDPNAEQSYLLRSVAQLLPEFESKTNKAGESCAWFTLEPTHPHKPEETRRLNLIIKDALDFQVPLAITDPAIVTHFKQYQPLAHPFFNTCREVDGILAGDFAAKVFLPKIEAPLDDGPLAYLTIFGWMVSGPWKNCSCHPRPGVC